MSADEMCGDYPAPCNCDDPETHDGAVTAADRPSVTEEPRHFAPYGSTNAICDETVPRLTPWVAKLGEWGSDRFTVRWERTTCRDCLVYQPLDRPSVTDNALAEAWAEGHRTGWEHCQDGNYGNDHWDDPTPNPYAAAGRAETTTATPPGLTVSEDGSVLNWQGVNYVPQRAETTTATDEDATVEQVADALEHWDRGIDWRLAEQENLTRAAYLRGAEQLLGLLATARTRPTREQIDRAVGEVLSNAANHPDPVAVLGRSIAPLRNKITDAVLELLRGGA